MIIPIIKKISPTVKKQMIVPVTVGFGCHFFKNKFFRILEPVDYCSPGSIFYFINLNLIFYRKKIILNYNFIIFKIYVK